MSCSKTFHIIAFQILLAFVVEKYAVQAGVIRQSRTNGNRQNFTESSKTVRNKIQVHYMMPKIMLQHPENKRNAPKSHDSIITKKDTSNDTEKVNVITSETTANINYKINQPSNRLKSKYVDMSKLSKADNSEAFSHLLRENNFTNRSKVKKRKNSNVMKLGKNKQLRKTHRKGHHIKNKPGRIRKASNNGFSLSQNIITESVNIHTQLALGNITHISLSDESESPNPLVSQKIVTDTSVNKVLGTQRSKSVDSNIMAKKETPTVPENYVGGTRYPFDSGSILQETSVNSSTEIAKSETEESKILETTSAGLQIREASMATNSTSITSTLFYVAETQYSSESENIMQGTPANSISETETSEAEESKMPEITTLGLKIREASVKKNATAIIDTDSNLTNASSEALESNITQTVTSSWTKNLQLATTLSPSPYTYIKRGIKPLKQFLLESNIAETTTNNERKFISPSESAIIIASTDHDVTAENSVPLKGTIVKTTTNWEKYSQNLLRSEAVSTYNSNSYDEKTHQAIEKTTNSEMENLNLPPYRSVNTVTSFNTDVTTLNLASLGNHINQTISKDQTDIIVPSSSDVNTMTSFDSYGITKRAILTDSSSITLTTIDTKETENWKPFLNENILTKTSSTESLSGILKPLQSENSTTKKSPKIETISPPELEVVNFDSTIRNDADIQPIFKSVNRIAKIPANHVNNGKNTLVTESSITQGYVQEELETRFSKSLNNETENTLQNDTISRNLRMPKHNRETLSDVEAETLVNSVIYTNITEVKDEKLDKRNLNMEFGTINETKTGIEQSIVKVFAENITSSNNSSYVFINASRTDMKIIVPLQNGSYSLYDIEEKLIKSGLLKNISFFRELAKKQIAFSEWIKWIKLCFTRHMFEILIAVGLVIFLVLLILLICCVKRRKVKKTSDSSLKKEPHYEIIKPHKEAAAKQKRRDRLPSSSSSTSDEITKPRVPSKQARKSIHIVDRMMSLGKNIKEIDFEKQKLLTSSSDESETKEEIGVKEKTIDKTFVKRSSSSSFSDESDIKKEVGSKEKTTDEKFQKKRLSSSSSGDSDTEETVRSKEKITGKKLDRKRLSSSSSGDSDMERDIHMKERVKEKMPKKEKPSETDVSKYRDKEKVQDIEETQQISTDESDLKETRSKEKDKHHHRKKSEAKPTEELLDETEEDDIKRKLSETKPRKKILRETKSGETKEEKAKSKSQEKLMQISSTEIETKDDKKKKKKPETKKRGLLTFEEPEKKKDRRMRKPKKRRTGKLSDDSDEEDDAPVPTVRRLSRWMQRVFRPARPEASDEEAAGDGEEDSSWTQSLRSSTETDRTYTSKRQRVLTYLSPSKRKKEKAFKLRMKEKKVAPSVRSVVSESEFSTELSFPSIDASVLKMRIATTGDCKKIDDMLVRSDWDRSFFTAHDLETIGERAESLHSYTPEERRKLNITKLAESQAKGLGTLSKGSSTQSLQEVIGKSVRDAEITAISPKAITPYELKSQARR